MTDRKGSSYGCEGDVTIAWFYQAFLAAFYVKKNLPNSRLKAQEFLFPFQSYCDGALDTPHSGTQP